MDINDELKELRQQKHHFVERGKFADKELEKMRLASNLEYIDRYNLKRYNAYLRVGVLNKKIEEICLQIEKYSRFDCYTIGKILSELITTFEGEEFIYEESIEYYPQKHIDPLHANIIVAHKKNKNYYYERYLYSLIKHGNAIVLLKDTNAYMDNVWFYEADSLLRINQNVNFGRFPYAKEFIDNVIKYKMQNHIDNITEDELQKLKIEFIKSRTSQIVDNCQVRDKRKLEEFKQMLEHENIVRNRQLSKTLNRYNSNENQK